MNPQGRRRALLLVLGVALLALVTVGPGIPYRTTAYDRIAMPVHGGRAYLDSAGALETRGWHMVDIDPRAMQTLFRHRTWAFWRIPPVREW